MNEAQRRERRVDRLVGRLHAAWEQLWYGGKRMTPTQLARRIARGERWMIGAPICCDCGRPIQRNDDAGLCTRCGGMNLPIVPPNTRKQPPR